MIKNILTISASTGINKLADKYIKDSTNKKYVKLGCTCINVAFVIPWTIAILQILAETMEDIN